MIRASQTTEETSSETSAIENRIYYMVTGQPAVCPEQMECPDGVDMVALTIARRNPDPRYLMLAEGVAMCDAGKLPARHSRSNIAANIRHLS